jgi:hypothetical protein
VSELHYLMVFVTEAKFSAEAGTELFCCLEDLVPLPPMREESDLEPQRASESQPWMGHIDQNPVNMHTMSGACLWDQAMR